MTNLTDLASIYDCRDTAVCRRSATQAAILLTRTCLILRPHEWGMETGTHKWNDGSEGTLQSFLSAAPEREGTVSFGMLLSWACRRPNARVARYVYDAEAEGPVLQSTRSLHSVQSVGGYPFDRYLIREALQTFIEVDCPTDWYFELRLSHPSEGRILSIAGYEITAFIMSLRLDAECGNDPMPCDWSKPIASAEVVK